MTAKEKLLAAINNNDTTPTTNKPASNPEVFEDFEGYEPDEPPQYVEDTEPELVRETPKGKSAQAQEESGHVEPNPQTFSKLDGLRRPFDHKRPFKLTEYIGGLFARGGVTVIIGSPGVGKSTFLQKCIHDICGAEGEKDDSFRAVFADSEGQNRLAVETKARKVILLTGELGEDNILERTHEFSWFTKPEKFEVIDLQRFEEEGINLNINEPDGLKNFEHLAQTHSLDLIVIDSLGMFYTGKENDNDELRVVFKNLAGIARRYNIAVGIVHHARKRLASEQKKPLTLDDTIGGSAINRYVHRVIAVEYNGDRGLNVVTCLKSWGKWFKQFGYRKIEETWGHSRLEFEYKLKEESTIGNTQNRELKPTPQSEAETMRREIKIVLKARENKPTTQQELGDFLEISNDKNKKNNLHSVLGRMEEKGEIIRPKRGVYTLPENRPSESEEDTAESESESETLTLELE